MPLASADAAAARRKGGARGFGRKCCIARRERGRMAQAGGLAAEDIVARHYLRRGHTIVAHRWRGGGGEIDLILRNDTGVVFVEIKQAASIEAAAERLRPAQIARIQDAIGAFLSGEPDGLMTELRLDLALVNARGEVHVLENLMAA